MKILLIAQKANCEIFVHVQFYSRLIYLTTTKSSDLPKKEAPNKYWCCDDRLVTIMNWHMLKDWVSTGVCFLQASHNLVCLGLFTYNANKLKTTLAHCDLGIQDCLLILLPAIPDLTIELVSLVSLV